MFLVKAAKGKGVKILTPKQIHQRLPIALAQVKAANTSEYILDEIRKFVCRYIEQNKLLKKYATI